MKLGHKLTHNIVTYIIGITLLVSSCTKIESYLDRAESGGMTEEEIFGNYEQTEGFLANIYASGIGSGEWFAVNNSFVFTAATDDARCQYNYSYAPIVFTNGSLSPTNNPIDVWGGRYQHIRKVNIFLKHIDHVPNSSNPNLLGGKTRMKGEAYFLRAFFYFELYKRYGTVPIVKKPLDITDDLNIPRATNDEMVSFMKSDCDSAILLLSSLRYDDSNLGRASKTAAMMLKSRMLLFAASKLHNPENDITKWEEAAEAAKDIIDLGIYSLAPNYRTMMHTRQSPEIIFQSNINQVWQVTDKDWVRIMQPPSQGGGWANTQPLQNLVDTYEMSDGSVFDWNNTAHAANPYQNRDPRMAATIIHNGSLWAGSTIQTYVGAGLDGLNFGNGSTQTGYYMGAKMLDETSTLVSPYRPGSHFWIFMRYAETLLNYAEAQNEVLSAPDQSIYNAINEIRSRPSVNMPSLPNNLNKDQMRNRIRHERRIEMAIEDTRFWDIRRWRIGQEVMNEAYGMRIIRNGNNYTYERFLIENRVYRPAFDLFPIPLGEIQRNKALVQNPGYLN